MSQTCRNSRSRRRCEAGGMTRRSFSRLAETLNIILLFLWLPFSGCALSDQVDNRNFAVDAYSPTPNEIQLAERRAQHYWDNNSQRSIEPTRYLAVATSSISGGNIYPKLIKSETTSSYFGQDSQTPSLHASCVMVYDTVTKSFVGNSGYLSVDLPRRGSLARWDTYIARYIGWGS
jgi:hypothetical protein